MPCAPIRETPGGCSTWPRSYLRGSGPPASFEGRSELIDHILVSRALLETVEAVSTVAPGPLPSITDNANARRDATVSDHSMIIAQLDLG